MNPLASTAVLGGAAWGVAELAPGGRLDRMVRPAAAWYVACVDGLRDNTGIRDASTAVGIYQRQLARALAERGPSLANSEMPRGQTHGELRTLTAMWLYAVSSALGWPGSRPMLAELDENTRPIGDAWANLEAARDQATPAGASDELLRNVPVSDAGIAQVWSAIRELAVAVDRGRPTEIDYHAPGFFDVPLRAARGAVDAAVGIARAPFEAVAGGIRDIAEELLYVGAVVAGAYLFYKAAT